jgi:hypothetical protein
MRRMTTTIIVVSYDDAVLVPNMEASILGTTHAYWHNTNHAEGRSR